MVNIPEIGQKIKNLAEDLVGEWGLFIIVFLLALSAFGLGRLSVLEDAKPLVSIGQAATTPTPRSMTQGGLIVAARSGSVYYYPWCTGAAKIAPANQVWFTSEAAARAAGYAPAKACKGLQ